MPSPNTVSAIIVAAGSSRRMGFDKLMAPLAGEPVVVHSLLAFQACEAVGEIVLVTREDLITPLRERAAALGVTKLSQVLPGGATRSGSVWAGLQAADARYPYFAVHDGARPLITPAAITACLGVAEKMGAASCAAPVVETLKRAHPPELLLAESVSRENLWAMQTPQIFRRSLLIAAYEALLAAGEDVTDETSALERQGTPVALYHNIEWNPKITFPADLELAQRYLEFGRAIRDAE